MNQPISQKDALDIIIVGEQGDDVHLHEIIPVYNVALKIPGLLRIDNPEKTEEIVDACKAFIADHISDNDEWVVEQARRNESIPLISAPSPWTESTMSMVNEIVKRHGVKYLYDVLSNHTLMGH